jgi:hypothetical protein
MAHLYKILIMKYIVLMSIILFPCFTLWSQGTSLGDKLNMTIYLMAGQSSLLNQGASGQGGYSQTAPFALGGGIEFGMRLSKNFRLISGLAYNPYHTNIELTTYTNSYSSTDSENDQFQMQVAGKAISEEQKLACLMVPLKLRFSIPLSGKMVFFISSEIAYSFLIEKSYIGRGVFSYSGYYPAYNITLNNLPEYGFPSDLNVSKMGELEVKPNFIHVAGSAGIILKMNKSLGLMVGLHYHQSLSNIADYQATGFQLSKNPDDYSSILGSSSGAKTRTMGLQLGIVLMM